MTLDTQIDSPTTTSPLTSPNVAAGRVRVATRRWPQLRTPLSLSGRWVVLAADDSPEAAAAGHVALALESERHARIRAVTVAERPPLPASPPLDTTIEPAAEAIARAAVGVGAALVVLGIKPAGKLEGAFHLETTLRVIRHAACPVLTISRGTTTLPRCVLVAVDFGVASLEAARAARALLEPGGKLLLAYAPPTTYVGVDEGAALIHDLGVEACFRRLIDEVAGDDIAIETKVLERDAGASTASVLLRYADAVGADLVAAGSARYGRLQHLLLGSVSIDLVRNGTRSTLIVPPLDGVTV